MASTMDPQLALKPLLRHIPRLHKLFCLGLLYAIARLPSQTIRLTSDLAKLTLESIESKFVIEARNLVDRDATGFSATDGHTPCCHCRRTNHSSDKCWKNYPFMVPKLMRFGKSCHKKKGPKRSFKKSGKSEDASATVHQVYTVCNDGGVTHYLYSVARETCAQKWILD